MHVIALKLGLFALAVTAAQADKTDACTLRQHALAEQAAQFQGDARIKRLIDADLRRALKEAAEGDSDECTEALDHAAKLLAGGV